MAIHTYGYSAESLQNDKIENLEKELESETKLINIKPNNMPSTMSDKFVNIQLVDFVDGETKLVVKAKLS